MLSYKIYIIYLPLIHEYFVSTQLILLGKTMLHFALCISVNNRVFHVASNSGSGYTSQVFDCNLGHFDSFVLDGSYIFAGQVRSCYKTCSIHVHILMCWYMRGMYN